ncbi:MAG: protease modulator HflC [Lachnospiraceae bacterium]|nr:protease modulator HflC [Lachnospiraceae bacterium]
MSDSYENAENIERIYQPRKKAPLIIIAVLVVLLIIVGSQSLVVTRENEYTLIRQFGKVERIITTSGLSFKVPFIQSTSKLPKELMLYDLTASDVITQDKKTMVLDSFVLWRIEDPLKFVQSLNSQISNAESRINAIVYNSSKNVVSSMLQSDVIRARDGELALAIKNNIGSVTDQYGIELVAVETKHLDLPSDNKTAVYERMISERNNIAASFTASGESEAKMIRTKTDNEIIVSVSEAEAQAEKLRSEGEAEYMRILSQVYKDESRADFYTFVRSLDAAKASMKGSKTLILTSDSPLAEIFNKIE